MKKLILTIEIGGVLAHCDQRKQIYGTSRGMWFMLTKSGRVEVEKDINCVELPKKLRMLCDSEKMLLLRQPCLHSATATCYVVPGRMSSLHISKLKFSVFLTLPSLYENSRHTAILGPNFVIESISSFLIGQTQTDELRAQTYV
ncbi:hypothetical protein VNO77_25095 [Canavalia gladiata]|uniref:Uncharacterized protein n=1 Tax=Canavalia gladiata TaxID=3824 RepID=A0AAN9QDA6_CANGL